MKKTVCFLLSALLLMSPVFALTATEAVPCAYENIVLFREGDLLQMVKDARGEVCRLDGSAVLDTTEPQILIGGYIRAGSNDGQSLYSIDGEKITDTWDEISEVAHDIAICGKGSWGRPNTLYGVYGALDLKTGKWIVPQAYPSLQFSRDGTCFIAKAADGRHAFDLTGAEIPVPASESERITYGNGMYRLAGGTALYYSDGGLAVPAIYSEIEAVCGDVIFAKKPNDETLYCLSLTGQLLSSYPNAYIAFSETGFDYVLLGKDRSVDEIAIVNRWGEMISPFTEGDAFLSSGGSNGRGLELFHAATGKTRWLMADGAEIPYIENGILLANLGLILVGGETPSLLDLNGAPVVPAGEYRFIGTDHSVYQIARESAKPNGLVVQNMDGKYGLLRMEGGYEYPAHAWAQMELDEAIAAGIVPEKQRRDWRDGCTRGDFCRLVTAVLDASGKPLAEFVNIAFTDTADDAILHAARLGVVNGVGDGRFAPDRPVTRQEAAVMLARAAELLELQAAGAEKQFSDQSEFAEWARDGIAKITRITGGGTPVMQGVSAERFSARGVYTREQAVLTMLRLYRAVKA